ncbi:GNAT family N-acetyltransferase [Amycolatopsis jiangsuensis]|uniref:RimJ/RimL family protein N-acetyltransferase/catechol 2,3-dioxygenase-like lactoylglutathione lyase family enzyme n=1 Tax=Amycolatopsis jiangsuensis TaxID=1181879 RepID=A0A840IU27_9PSEU|nr:GNAT family N-acetyltransferase [Amycolatopsis jiangsuensis]MBB4684658.1 RimJ/RimL family protein N-acetyltransferase/catechol 2,3-dioxygenase-like lactoylglutathione lyase family enzyme [Amycolatopsis jiangsuensis]
MTPPPELATGRLRLRPLAPADRAAVVALFADPAMSRYFAADFSDPAQARALVAERLAASPPAGQGHWVIEHAGALIGLASLRPSSVLPGAGAEIGYSVATEHAGTGFATEAVTAVLEHAHDFLGLPAVYALVHEDNAASLAVSARTGFLDVGSREHFGATHRVLIALPPARRGRLHHVELWVPDLARAEQSWGWLLGRLGWREFQRWPAGVSWRSGVTYLVVEQVHAGSEHDRIRSGLNHLALHAGTRAEVDRFAGGGHGWRPLFADRYPHAGGPEHYAAYLENEDGFEVELVATDTP